MRSLKTGRKTSSVASAVWHVAPSFWNQMLPISQLFNFCEQKFVQHGPITIAIGCNGLSLLIFEEKCPNYASAPKSAANSDSFWVRQLFVWVFCAPNATILLVYISAKIKMSFIWKDDFLFLPKSSSSVSRSQAHLAKRKCNGWSIGFNSWTNWTLYGVSMMSPKCSIVENNGELMLMALHTYFLPQQQYSRVYALILAFHALVYRWGCQFLSLFCTR